VSSCRAFNVASGASSGATVWWALNNVVHHKDEKQVEPIFGLHYVCRVAANPKSIPNGRKYTAGCLLILAWADLRMRALSGTLARHDRDHPVPVA
jgi:hypothetical protein